MGRWRTEAAFTELSFLTLRTKLNSSFSPSSVKSNSLMMRGSLYSKRHPKVREAMTLLTALFRRSTGLKGRSGRGRCKVGRRLHLFSPRPLQTPRPPCPSATALTHRPGRRRRHRGTRPPRSPTAPVTSSPGRSCAGWIGRSAAARARRPHIAPGSHLGGGAGTWAWLGSGPAPPGDLLTAPPLWGKSLRPAPPTEASPSSPKCRPLSHPLQSGDCSHSLWARTAPEAPL